jgi:hypothetical protein
MRGAIPPLPQYASMAWCSVKNYFPCARFEVLTVKIEVTVFFFELCNVVVDTSVSEDRDASIFRVQRSSEVLVSNHHITKRNNPGNREFCCFRYVFIKAELEIKARKI